MRVGHVLETQQFILGEPVAAFEKASASQLGVAHAIGCSSGTDALWLALAAAGIGPGRRRRDHTLQLFRLRQRHPSRRSHAPAGRH
jgi:MYXO-CTERM domain-containing protein